MKINSISEFEHFSEDLKSKQTISKPLISICCGTGCAVSGAGEVFSKISEKIETNNLDAKIDVVPTGCHGFCEKGPLVVIRNPGGKEKIKEIFYQQVKPEDVNEIIEETILKGKIVERLLYIDPVTGRKVIEESDVPFYKYQKRLLLANNGKIDPTKINDYISAGGYKSLTKALGMKSEEIIDEIKKSGLRGRGGAGFPTGKKWELCRKVKTTEISQKGQTHLTKYVICNADEGDPGAFMDRSLIEGNPHSIVEGMIIGAYAICGGTDYKPAGYVYLRNEYPLALKHLQIALEQAREYGLLGENILGSGFSFDIEIHRGAGAFVCGEETALLQSIEGKIGRPTPRPPYPAECGLFGKPTNINNVKTWASVPIIINNGSEWYSNIGTKTSKGTMIFSLVGKIENTGLIEVPMGITLREIIYKIGGGLPEKKFKVQVGGPSGGLIPENMLDLPIDYESLAKIGSMMGSGGLIVTDENTCMVNMAKFFLAFTQQESCGKCTPCREGTKYMLRILEKITAGKAEEKDLLLLEETANMVKETALCGLGNTAPNPVLSTLRYFREEYVEHIEKKKCRAKICQALIEYSILEDKCTGCVLCLKRCPSKAITGEPKKLHKIDLMKCTKCGICLEVCKFNAVEVK